MTDAREIMAQAQADYWENPSIPEGYLPMVDHVLAVLTSAGFRILGPDEIDGPTVEKCAEVAETCPDTPFAISRKWYGDLRQSIPAAIRALQEKRS